MESGGAAMAFPLMLKSFLRRKPVSTGFSEGKIREK